MLLSKDVLLLHDDALLHAAYLSVQIIEKLGPQVLSHLPYSPDLVPSDYLVYGPLEKAIRGRRFTSDVEMQEVVHLWIISQPKKFFSDGMKKLVKNWNLSAEKQGDYVQV
ncbi:hypothetical protein M513_08617 [Trichuris suis]|uniref:Mos1 transposase HTH domain-containing protein n=1 Tax=Trichuris suis TaxID=68888 RepID=A0A085M003_9BILA|nr:hypothetical protein M513_08617 [Trichuris suis]